ncbi:hypothetical protein CDAR_57391 [Caerostris darwini]|uniref:Uncharacterized protein n=1 Tax=Caerostris darwini TaxID=1538125 RepID=A0AAV4TNL8_9ARAC|nr:hypothetical protein CDAR_57391 [Caerostris darwini]
MMMNGTNPAYAACPQQPPVLDYTYGADTKHYFGGGDTKLLYGSGDQHHHYGYSEPAEPPVSQLPPQIINESNGRSYTNLDANQPSSVYAHSNGTSHCQQQAYIPTQTYFPQPSFEYSLPSNTDYMAAGYHNPSFQNMAHQHHHTASMNRTPGNMYGSSFHSGDVYEPQLPVSTADCQQVVNGLTPYHRTAVVPPLSQQQPPPPATQTPYKWMQVKRNTPRPVNSSSPPSFHHLPFPNFQFKFFQK